MNKKILDKQFHYFLSHISPLEILEYIKMHKKVAFWYRLTKKLAYLLIIVKKIAFKSFIKKNCDVEKKNSKVNNKFYLKYELN